VTVRDRPFWPVARHHVFLPAQDPIRRDALLRVGERVFDETMKLVLELVFFGIVRTRIIRLRSEVF